METKRRTTTLKIVCVAVILLVVIGIVLFALRGTPASDIIFCNDTINLIAGETQKLSYEIVPNNVTNKSVKWQSSNPAVVSVDDSGEIIAISEGEAIIMVTTANGKIDECLVSVKPTAFDYLKKLGNTSEGYTVGDYIPSSGAMISIGLYYNNADNSVYIMNDYSKNGRRIALSSIAIPNSLHGDYEGALEQEILHVGAVHSVYKVDASKFTANTDVTSYYCDGASWCASLNDELFAACLRSTLNKLYQDILEPNGYKYADLGFDLYGLTP